MNEADLVARGLKVNTRHLRFYAPIDNRMSVSKSHPPVQFLKGSNMAPYPRGGITRVVVIAPQGLVLAIGEAYCSPKDNYDRRAGKQLALERAILKVLDKIAEVAEGR